MGKDIERQSVKVEAWGKVTTDRVRKLTLGQVKEFCLYAESVGVEPDADLKIVACDPRYGIVFDDCSWYEMSCPAQASVDMAPRPPRQQTRRAHRSGHRSSWRWWVLAAEILTVLALALFFVAIWTSGPNTARFTITAILILASAAVLGGIGGALWDYGRQVQNRDR